LQVVAQDATPEAGMEEVDPYQRVAITPHVLLPSEASLIVVKVTLEPGASSPLAEDDPIGGMLVLEAGTITVRVEEDWELTRAEGRSGLFGIPETILSGKETPLKPGDVAYIPGSVEVEVRNDGEEVAIGTLFLIVPLGETVTGISIDNPEDNPE